jgi:hypothetical protein
MAGAIKVRNKHTIPVILDGDILEEFKSSIRMPIGEYFRRHQREVVDEERKKVEARSMPILGELPENDEDNTIQTTLNSFMDIEPEDLEELDDSSLEPFRRHCAKLSVACVQIKRQRGVLR